MGNSRTRGGEDVLALYQLSYAAVKWQRKDSNLRPLSMQEITLIQSARENS